MNYNGRKTFPCIEALTSGGDGTCTVYYIRSKNYDLPTFYLYDCSSNDTHIAPWIYSFQAALNTDSLSGH